MNQILRKGFASSIPIRRGVFDIGSGSIKLQVAEVDPVSNKIVKHISSKNQQVLFMKDLKKSNSNSLS